MPTILMPLEFLVPPELASLSSVCYVDLVTNVPFLLEDKTTNTGWVSVPIFL